MSHSQLANDINKEKLNSDGIMKEKMKKNVQKAMDMQFYWVRYQVEQKNFYFKWKTGNMKLGYYFTKHHTTTHHWSMCQTYLLNAFISLQEHILKSVLKPVTSKVGNTWIIPNLGRDRIDL